MILKKMVLKGFKSIKGEETLHLDDKVTILIGANDHGKSNLLAAIQCLNSANRISPEDRNWDLPENEPVQISWHFAVSAEIEQKLSQLARIEPTTLHEIEATELENSEEGAQPSEDDLDTPPDSSLVDGASPILDDTTKGLFDPPEKISKLLIATMYEDLRSRDSRQLPDLALGQLQTIMSSLSIRSEKSEKTGVFVEAS